LELERKRKRELVRLRELPRRSLHTYPPSLALWNVNEVSRFLFLKKNLICPLSVFFSQSLRRWLFENGFGDYISLFVKHEIDGNTLRRLDR
jgi:hypothetical protein